MFLIQLKRQKKKRVLPAKYNQQIIVTSPVTVISKDTLLSKKTVPPNEIK
jgi:hypothetical protein